jgi:hypothetical protein
MPAQANIRSDDEYRAWAENMGATCLSKRIRCPPPMIIPSSISATFGNSVIDVTRYGQSGAPSRNKRTGAA